MVNPLQRTERTLVLASTSPYRRKILDDLGVAYIAASPRFDEDHQQPLPPEALVVSFARGKAESLRDVHPDALIVGSDQMPEIDGRALGKPGTVEVAVEQLLALAGCTHRLLTAVAVHDARHRRTTHRLIVHEMTMRPLTRALAEAYVARDRPLDCAGAYKIEAHGVLLFSSMRGEDHTAIVGLPVAALATLLDEAGASLLHSSLL